MPWAHCGREINDDAVCPGCGLTKAAWTVSWEATRQFKLRRRPALRLALVDEGGRALAGERFHVRLADGTTHEGTLDELGTARVPASAGTSCKVTFPDRPGRAVVRTRTARPGTEALVADPLASDATTDEATTDDATAPATDDATPDDAPADDDAVEAGNDGSHEVPVETGRHTFVARVCGLRVEQVWILGDDDAAEPVADVEQVVNLPAAAPFLGTGEHQVRDRARFGRLLRVKVRLSHASTAADLRVHLEPAAGNVPPLAGHDDDRHAYGPREPRDLSVTVGADRTAILPADTARISAIGADAFTVVVSAAGGSARSQLVTAVQRLYLLTLPMRGVTAISNLHPFRAELRRGGVDLVHVGESPMDRMACVHGDDWSPLCDVAHRAYDRSGHLAYEPHLIAAGFIDQAATPAEVDLEQAGVSVGPGQPDVSISVVGTTAARAALWLQVDDPDPGWFLSASFDDDAGFLDVDVPHALVRSTASNPRLPRQHDTVVVQAFGGPFATGAVRRGTLRVRVRVADAWLGGLSISEGNLILSVTRCGWGAASQEGQLLTLRHEAGHKLGMVPGGVGHPTRYEDHGHFGRHCHHGLELIDDFTGKRGECTMFGSTNVDPAEPFCADCVIALRRQDLAQPFSRFPTSAGADV